MRTRYGNSPARRAAPGWLRWLGRHAPLLFFILISSAGLLWVYVTFSPSRGAAQAVTAANSALNRSAPIYKNVPARPVWQRLPQSTSPIRIGLIIGHLDSDSGATCEDGLTEVALNRRIVDLVAAELSAAGVTTELMAEFDERLNGYNGTGLVSVHADSCDYFNDRATGFKIAGSSRTDSSVLEGCMERAYGQVTQLSYHANTITPHMTDYHAFRKIAPGTPAIIVETGFMNLDRDLLANNPTIPARGLTAGILCFLEARQ